MERKGRECLEKEKEELKRGRKEEKASREGKREKERAGEELVMEGKE